MAGVTRLVWLTQLCIRSLVIEKNVLSKLKSDGNSVKCKTKENAVRLFLKGHPLNVKDTTVKKNYSYWCEMSFHR